jgi:hypothetical protein
LHQRSIERATTWRAVAAHRDEWAASSAGVAVDAEERLRAALADAQAPQPTS